MRIKIIYDNEAKTGFKSDWGFSALIQSEENVLFDTGAKPRLLKYNMEKFGITKNDIDKIVLSHPHRDHTGGIEAVLEEDSIVYILESFPRRFKRNLKGVVKVDEISSREEISKGIVSTGEIKGGISEQSLFMESKGGYILLTGCAHPGLHNIIKNVGIGDINTVIGGFHGFKKFDILENMSRVIPCHCTKYKSEISKIYPEKYGKCAAGCELIF